MSRLPRLSPPSEEFPTLDALRFLSSIGIVLFHTRLALDLSAEARAISDRFDGLANLVDLFFAISGFVICHVYHARMDSWAHYGRYMRNRVARIAPLHWLTLAFFVALASAFALRHPQLPTPPLYNWHCVAPNIFFLQSFGLCANPTHNFVSWSISAEMGCYLLFPVFLYLLRRSVWLPALAAMVMIALLSLAGPAGLSDTAWGTWTAEGGILRALPGFTMGIFYYAIRQWLARIPKPHLLSLIALAAFFMLPALGLNPLWSPLLAYGVVAIAVGADAAPRRATGLAALMRKIAPLGQLTYSLYMLQVPVLLTGFNFAVIHLLHLNGLARNAMILCGIALLIPVSYVSLFVFEFPVRRWIARLGAPLASKSDTLDTADRLAP